MTKQVFLWKAYGEFAVYAVDTPEQIHCILDDVYLIARHNTYEDAHPHMQSIYEKNKDTEPKAVINWLIEEVGYDCDSFEYGTGFYDVKEEA